MVKIHVVLQIACQRQRWHKDTPLCCYTWELKSLLFGNISDKKSNYKAFPQCDGTCDSSGHSFWWTVFDSSHNFLIEMASSHCRRIFECSHISQCSRCSLEIWVTKNIYKAFPQCDGTCDSSGHSFGWTMFDRSHNFMLEMASPHCGEGCECSRLWHWKNISHTFHNVSAWIFCFWWFCLPMSIYLVLLPLQIQVLKMAFLHCAFSNDFAKGLLVIQSHIGRI